MAGCLLDLSIYPAVLGGSLRLCEQPATRLKARNSSDKDIHVKVAFMDEGCFATVSQAQRLQDALLKTGAKSTLTILYGAGHEAPAFMETEMVPTLEFLDSTLGR